MAAGQSGKNLSEAGIIIQARMGSTRLPQKVLMPIGASNMFSILVKRLKKAGLPVVLATSVLPADDRLEEAAHQLDIGCYRGSEEDVLSRYYEAARAHHLQVIVRVTGDNPLLDGELIRQYVDLYVQTGNENLYMSTSPGKTFPVGISFEIFSFGMLETAFNRSESLKEREHVTPYFYTSPGRYDIYPVNYEFDKSFYRLTVDTADDLALIRTLIEQYNADNLGYRDIIAILDKEQNLAHMNVHVSQKKWNE